MNTAVIAEYNPFHNGHIYHIEQTKKLTQADTLTAIISGNFVQRGEPSIIEKSVRTRQALENGIDLVLELPVQYATGAADIFGRNAVEILEKSGIVDALCFGSECGDINTLSKVAEILAEEPLSFKNNLSEYLSQGFSYPSAREKAVIDILGHNFSGIMDRSNNILALEYLTALKKMNSKIKPFTIQRQANSYNDKQLSGNISSATSIRESLYNGIIPQNAIPQNTINDYKNFKFPTLEDYSETIAYLIRRNSPESLSEIADITEGLENRILSKCNEISIAKMLDKIKTKRYTHTKLQRAILHILLDITKYEQSLPPKYIRVLGFRRDTGEKLLKNLVKNSNLPIITNVKENEQLLKKEIFATDIYHIATDGKLGCEFTNGIVRL